MPLAILWASYSRERVTNKISMRSELDIAACSMFASWIRRFPSVPVHHPQNRPGREQQTRAETRAHTQIFLKILAILVIFFPRLIGTVNLYLWRRRLRKERGLLRGIVAVTPLRQRSSRLRK